MKKLFKIPKDKHLKTGVRTKFINLKENVLRVQVITPYMFNEILNNPIT